VLVGLKLLQTLIWQIKKALKQDSFFIETGKLVLGVSQTNGFQTLSFEFKEVKQWLCSRATCWQRDYLMARTPGPRTLLSQSNHILTYFYILKFFFRTAQLFVCLFVCLFVFVLLGMEPRALCRLGKCSAGFLKGEKFYKRNLNS
jgi:hypothetical protein